MEYSTWYRQSRCVRINCALRNTNKTLRPEVQLILGTGLRLFSFDIYLRYLLLLALDHDVGSPP